MTKDIERKITKIYKTVFNKIFTKTRIKEVERGHEEVIEEAVNHFENSKLFKKFCEEFSKELTKKGLNKERGLWRKYFEAAKKLRIVGLPSNYSEFEKKMYKNIVNENFKMIKSIPQKVLEVYKQKSIQTLLEAVLLGSKSRKAFERELSKHGVTRAKIIARTETAKLQAAVREQRAVGLGSVAYIWQSSNDKRTRQSHKDMNNVVVFYRPYEQKPLLDNMRGNAGEFPNCRCTSFPILDENDIRKAQYKVYDYRTDNVITMMRHELIDAINNGQLN